MGFIGRYTIAALRETYPDTRIACLDDLSLSEETYLGSNVDFIKGDVRDSSLVDYLVGRCYRGIIHLAADSRVLPSLGDPALVLESARTNILGTTNILTAMTRTPHNLNLVYAGSSTAYGGQRRLPQNEAHLPVVASPYSATKLAGELMVRSFVVTFGIRATVLRYFQVYGPGQPSTGAYALVTGIFLRQFADGQPLTIEGDGTQTRDFVHVTDVARANVVALDKDSRGLPINIGSGKKHSIQQLADLISPEQVFIPPRRVDLKATHADIGRAESILGWKPTVSLSDGITQMKRIKRQQAQDFSPGPYIQNIVDPLDECHRGLCFPLLRHCLKLCEPGFALEFGVFEGHSLRLIARHLKSIGFDSFKGLPESWESYPEVYPAGMFATDPPEIPNTDLVIGSFEDILPFFDFTSIDPLRLVHIDCDLYSSAKTIFKHLVPHLKPGVIVVFDEFFGFNGEEGDEGRAWREHCGDLKWQVIGNTVRPWAIKIV